MQAIAAAAYLRVNQLDGFYAVAIVFGMAYGGVMPLYASLAREAFAPRILGTVLGAATMLSSLGMALGPAAGRLAVRPLRQLRLAVHRFDDGRPGRGRDRTGVPAPAARRGAARGSGLSVGSTAVQITLAARSRATSACE